MKRKQVKVTWLDITFYSGSYSLEDALKLDVAKMETTGYILEKTKDRLVLASSFCKVEGEETWYEIHVIPIKTVVEITKMENT